MEWCANTSLLWDWDDHTPFGGDSGGGGTSSCSELGSGSSSKSIVSASFGSSAIAGKERELIANPRIHAKDKSLYESSCSPAEPRGGGVDESQLGLKLGKRTYFEDVSAESNTKNSSSCSESPPSPAAMMKKSRVSLQSSLSACCQVEGCNIDLSGAKNYHRKHRVCENHSKCPKVVIAGQERRFCQQCSRFHELSEFDQRKKSCRRRLSDHNARRRKPRPNLISFNSTACSLQFYDDKYHTNLLWNKGNFDNMISMATATNEGVQDFKLTQTGLLVKSTNCGIDGWLNSPNTQLSTGLFSLYDDVDKLLPLKGTTAEVLNQGSEASTGASNLNGAPDLRRALSLLSTSYWNSIDPGQSSSAAVDFVDVNHASVTQPMAPLMMSSSSWICSRPAAQRAQLLPSAMLPSGNQPQDFQLQNIPYADPRYIAWLNAPGLCSDHEGCEA